MSIKNEDNKSDAVFIYLLISGKLKVDQKVSTQKEALPIRIGGIRRAPKATKP